MHNYKIIEVLKSFNRKELTKFGEFVSSPYFNKNRHIIKLFEVLEKYYPQFVNKKLEIEEIFKKVFPKDDYDYYKINNVVSDLYKLAEKYFSAIEYDKDPYSGKLYLLKQMHSRKLDKMYEQKYTLFLDEINKIQVKDEEYFNMLFKMYDDYSKFVSETNPNTNLNMLQQVFDTDFTAALIKMLRYYNLMIHESAQNNVTYNMRMFDEVLDYLKKNSGSIEKNFKEPPILSIYKNITGLVTNKEKEYYTELIRLKSIYKNEITDLDRHLLYIHLWDFIAYNINILGNYEYYHDAFRLNKDSIADGIFSLAALKYPDFLNIVKTACAAKEFDWAVEFIENYKSAIPDEERENVLNFSYGSIENKKGNLNGALKYFSKTNFSNYILKVQVKLILCKLYYELKMYEQTLSMIDTFRHYLQREKMILDEQKESYYGFLKNLYQLVKIKENFNGRSGEAELVRLQKDINALPSNQFGVRTWLNEKVETELSSGTL